MTLAELEQQASPEAVRLAVRLLESDIAARAWVDQVGYCITQSDAAQLLGRSEQAVSKDPRLLRLARSDGRPAYPAFQFDGRRQVPGLAEVVRALDGSLLPATVAAWLTGTQPALGGRRPLDALVEGDGEAVLAVARRLARRSAL
ncbi:MAG: hypothetical protein ACRDYD_02040 [Acidimicrobiales bacterium]